MPTSRPAVLSPLASFVAVLTLAGCGSVKPPPQPSPPPAKSAVDQRSGAPAALATERQWLQSWFKDTPVQIRPAAEGAVSIEVPRAFSFEPGSSSVKPALGAVLDKVAESLRRVPQAWVSVLAAPDDGSAATPLAVQRATQMRQHLGTRGVAAARLGKPTATTAAVVQLRIEATAPH